MAAGVVGFVGLGNMGIPMARRLVAAGYQVRGFDTSAQARRNFAAIGSPGELSSADAGAADGGDAGTGAADGDPGARLGGVTVADALTSVGDGADAVILMLPDSDVVERVLLGGAEGGHPADGEPPGGGLLARLPAGATVIDMSSSDPARTKVLAATLARAGVTLIDAPVSGGVAGARAGTLTVMVGGPATAFETFRPMLAAIGGRVVHAGDVGAGHAVKALNNLMSAAHLLASSEAIIAGQRFGLDPAIMLEIVNSSSGRSWSTQNKWPTFVLTERYDAGFSLRLMVKDIKLALAIEQATGTPSTASAAVVAAWEAAAAELPADADHTAIARWVARPVSRDLGSRGGATVRSMSAVDGRDGEASAGGDGSTDGRAGRGASSAEPKADPQ
jgi:3-hydroxyisobutyrate dehydrogenase